MAYLVGGFFGFIKKAFKKVAGIVGKVAGTALGVASIAVPGPAGRLIAGISGKLAGVKSAYQRVSNVNLAVSQAFKPPGLLQKLSPVMPGGSVAQYGRGIPPILRGSRAFSGKPKGKPKKRKASRKRKLKFGSPAWRKRYMKKRR